MDLEPPYLRYQEADPAMKDRTATPSRAPHPVDNVHPAARTSRYHYAAMRRADGTARSISVQTSVRGFLGAGSLDEFNRLKAVRDSYYLLAAAHRAAGRRIERRSRRALAWSDFKTNPFLEIGFMAGDRARSVRRKTSRMIRSIRRSVSV